MIAWWSPEVLRASHDVYMLYYLQDEWLREQEYFDRLEKKENMEEKLRNITELRVKVVQCKEVCTSHTSMQ